jgi:hypothetical protein
MASTAVKTIRGAARAAPLRSFHVPTSTGKVSVVSSSRAGPLISGNNSNGVWTSRPSESNIRMTSRLFSSTGDSNNAGSNSATPAGKEDWRISGLGKLGDEDEARAKLQAIAEFQKAALELRGSEGDDGDDASSDPSKPKRPDGILLTQQEIEELERRPLISLATIELVALAKQKILNKSTDHAFIVEIWKTVLGA